MAEVGWNRDGISYLFTSNRVTLSTISGFFPSLKSLPQPYCRLETRERAFFGTGDRFTIFISSKNPELGLVKQGPLLA